MRDAALLIFALLLLGGVILLLMHLRYRHSPAVLWRGRVSARRSELRMRRQELLTSPVNSSVAALADELFARHFRTVPVTALLSQPGIGPATVDKLQSAGWQSMADVKTNQLDTVPGLGTAKAAEVRNAVRVVTFAERATFDAGACPEGAEYRRQAAALAALDQSATDERARQVAAVEASIVKVDALVAIVNDVSFWNTLFFQKVPGLTDEVLHRELPEPDLTPRPPDQSSPRVTRAPDVAGARVARGEDNASSPPPPAPEPPAVVRLRAVCRFGILVAKADGRVANAERTVLRTHLGQAFASDAVALRFIDVEVEAALKLTLDEADVIAGVKDFSPADRRELLALADRIASAAGQVSAKEQQLLARLHAALGEPPPPPPADPRHNPDLDAAFAAPTEAPAAPPPATDLRHNPDLDAAFGM